MEVERRKRGRATGTVGRKEVMNRDQGEKDSEGAVDASSTESGSRLDQGRKWAIKPTYLKIHVTNTFIVQQAIMLHDLCS